MEILAPNPPPAPSQTAAGDYKNIRRLVWVLGASGFLLICAFDLGPQLAFLDDWIYAWDVRHFDPLNLHLYPYGSALALVQIVWAWVVTLGHPDQRLLRLSIVPFILLVMYALYQLARYVGAGKTWSMIAAIAPLAFPIFTANATTFMSDAPYVALLLVAALGAVRWSEGRKWIALCVGFAVLATLQRQIGATIPVAVSIALFWRRGTLRLPQDIVGLALLWLGCLAAVVLPALTGIAPATGISYIGAALSLNPIYFVVDLLFLPGAAGLGLLLFLPGLALGHKGIHKDRTRLLLFTLLLLEILVLVRVGNLFPGDVFSSLGFNATAPTINAKVSSKPLPLALPFYLGLEVMAVATFLAFIRRWRDWWPARGGQGGLMLLLLVVVQFLPLGLVQYLAIDRYYIPVILLLVPLAARAASYTTRPVLAASLALVLAMVGVAIYVVDEQDYQAWQVARNQAACLAYQYALPLDVQAGYEANAVYVEAPYYERTGLILGGIPAPNRVHNFSSVGPADPVIRIVFAGPNDPRPGYHYSSLAPGKLVLVTGPRGKGLNIKAPGSMVPNCP